MSSAIIRRKLPHRSLHDIMEDDYQENVLLRKSKRKRNPEARKPTGATVH